MALSCGLVSAQSWTQLSPTGTPPYSPGNDTVVYDSGTNTLIQFGGGLATTNTTMLLSHANGFGGQSQWTTLNPTGTLPPGRRNHSAVYDAVNNRMIIFGGVIGTGNGGLPAVNDTWVLVNANGTGGAAYWQQLLPSGPLPTIRAGNTAVYDPVSNSMIIFGGECCGTHITDEQLNDTWVLTNANGLGGTPQWIPLTTATTFPRINHTAVYDPATNRMIVFGGNSGSSYLSDTIILTNANGTDLTQPQWITLSTTTSTLGRLGHGAIYDAVNNRMTVFAGDTGLAGQYANDCWTLTNANGLGGSSTWTQLSPSGTLPSPRLEPTIAYDPATNVLIDFGGFDGANVVTDVWLLSSANGLAPLPQTISFGPISSQVVGTPLTLTAMASSGLAVSYQSATPGICTVAGSTVSFSAAGTCSITASQNGNSKFAAAAPVSQSFSVLATQTISFAAIPNKIQGNTVSLTATASSGLPVAYISLTSAVCTVSGSTVATPHPGTCTIEAMQAGNGTYVAAVPVSQTFSVLPAFTLTVSPQSQSAFLGLLAPVNVQIQSATNFTGWVTVSCSGGPSGSFCPGLPSSVLLLNGYGLLATSLYVPLNAAVGTYTVTFSVSSGTLADSTSAMFIVRPLL